MNTLGPECRSNWARVQTQSRDFASSRRGRRGSPAAAISVTCSDEMEVCVSKRELMHETLDQNVVPGAAVQDILSTAAEQHVVSETAEQRVITSAAEQNVGTIA